MSRVWFNSTKVFFRLYLIWLLPQKIKPLRLLFFPPPNQKRALWVMNGYMPIPSLVRPRATSKRATTWIEMKVTRIEVTESLKPSSFAPVSARCLMFLLLFHPNWLFCYAGSVLGQQTCRLHLDSNFLKLWKLLHCSKSRFIFFPSSSSGF